MKDRENFLTGIAASMKVTRDAEKNNGISAETNSAIITAMLMQFVIEKDMFGELEEWINEGRFNFPA